MPEKNIHEAILAIMKEVGYVQKERKVGSALNYSYAGEAALISAVRPSMVEHDVFMYISNIVRANRENYVTAKGTAMANTLIQSVVTFVHALSGTSIDVHCIGEGADSGDKSANKASTGAYKYAIRQTFCIETGDDPDKYSSDEQERATKPKSQAQRIIEDQDKIPSQDPSDAFKKHAGNLGDVTDTGVDEKFPPLLTPKEIRNSADHVGDLARDSGKNVTDVLAMLKTLDKDKKFSIAQLVKILKEENNG